MEKALREAKRNTELDRARRGLGGARARRSAARSTTTREFRADFEPFAAEVARAGDRAALAQLLLKLTVPGVPDVYQGDELLSLSLVDPDNRRPVDWERAGASCSRRSAAAPRRPTRRASCG